MKKKKYISLCIGVLIVCFICIWILFQNRQTSKFIRTEYGNSNSSDKCVFSTDVTGKENSSISFIDDDAFEYIKKCYDSVDFTSHFYTTGTDGQEHYKKSI